MANEAKAVVVPKKRKPESSDTTNGGIEVKQPKMIVEDKKSTSSSIYQRVTAFEEKEALERNPAVDLEQYQLLCKEFADHIRAISDLMTTKPEGWADKVKELRTEVGLLTIFMKKLNRIEKIRNRNSREEVTKKRQQVDVSQLQVQNLMCEIQHLNREVDKCLCFKSKPLGVDLVPVEEFFAKAPEKISRPEITKSDDHQLLIARLEWELFQRKELSVLYSKLEEKKKSLTTQINKKNCDLDSLAPLIKEVLTVTKPLQEKLGFTSSASVSKSDKASLLPNCLYFLYIQASAYKDASDNNISFEINGNEDLARLAMKQTTVNGEKDTGSSGDDSDCVEIDRATKRDAKAKIEKKRLRLLERHPLTVVIKIIFRDDSCLSLEFSYFTKLNIMTVMPTLNLANSLMKSHDSGEALLSRNVLANLFPGDEGIESPNVSNHYQLNEVGLESLDTKKYGFPYVWVQKIGGLDFTSALEEVVVPKLETAKTSIPGVMKVIRRRIHSRIALFKQVIALESKNVIGPPGMKSVKLTCSIKSWKPITWEEFKEHPAAAHLIESSSVVSPQDLFFYSLIVRGKAKMTVLSVVKSDYPMLPSVYTIQIETGDKTLNASNSSQIRDIEKEVNVFWKDLTKETSWTSTLIIFQIHRLMCSFDIFLECSDPTRFYAEKKTFLHSHRGRTRAHPYKYVQVGEGVFLHRTSTE